MDRYRGDIYYSRRSYMRKNRESYRAASGNIKTAWLQGLGRKICIGALAVSAAVAVIGGNAHSAFAGEYYTKGDYAGDEVLVEETGDLSDVLQMGGLGTSVTDDGSASLASTYDAAVLEERIISGFKEYSTSIDVSDLGLLIDDARNGAISDIISAHPEIISVAGYSYSYNTSSGLVATLSVTYSTNAEAEQQELDAAIKEVDSKVDITGMTDEEIVLAYHEYLTSSVAYAYEAYLSNSLGSKHEYDMYGALVNHSVVCQGYAETMFYFLKKAGLPCAIASSKNINHAWNIVKIHGNWYHIDATWDDPVWDVPGRSLHTYFLVSFDTMNKNTLTNHTKDRTDMVISAQSGDTYTSATDTTYESGKFWNGVDKVIFYNDGYWYSIGEGRSKTNYQINKYKYSTGADQTLYSGSATWYADEEGRYYVGQFGAIYIQGSILYFTTPDAVNKIDLSSSVVGVTEVANIRSKYSKGNNVYALGEQDGKLVYAVAASPNLTRTKDSTDSTKYNKDYDEYMIDVCISHVWDSGVVITAPTYTSTGTKKYTCTNCGETKTETIAKLVCTSHAWDAGVVTKEPTYTATGIKTYTCQNCGTTKTETIAKLVCTGHVWDSGVVITAPTYTSTGTKKYTCTNCGETKTETIAKLVCTSHVWDAGVVTKAPTYTTTGEKKYTCTNCGETRTETIGKLGCTSHVWDEGEVVTVPTYTSTGTKKFTCKNCGETKTEEIAKLECTEHIWDAGEVITEPTYKATGTIRYTCTNCGAIRTEEIAKLECTSHKWDAGEVITEPTYKTTGTIRYTCTNCGTIRTEEIAKLECTSHKWDAGVVTKAPTYTSAGTKKYTCVNCGTTKTSQIAMLKLSKVTVKAAVSSTGIKLTWSSEKNATGYYIYRKNAKGGYSLLKKITNAGTLTFTDTKVSSGTAYTYKVQAYRGTATGDAAEVSRYFVGTAKAKTTNESAGIKLSWNKVGGARSYKIYKKVGTGKYACVKTVSSTTLTYLDKVVKAGTTYTYAVKPYIGSAAGTYVPVKYVYLKPVTAKVSAARNGAAVRWTKAAGATSYRVYRKTAGGKYALVKKVSGANTLSWTDTNTAKGKTYYYYVRAFKGSYYSAASKAVNIKR